MDDERPQYPWEKESAKPEPVEASDEAEALFEKFKDHPDYKNEYNVYAKGCQTSGDFALDYKSWFIKFCS